MYKTYPLSPLNPLVADFAPVQWPINEDPEPVLGNEPIERRGGPLKRKDLGVALFRINW